MFIVRRNQIGISSAKSILSPINGLKRKIGSCYKHFVPKALKTRLPKSFDTLRPFPDDRVQSLHRSRVDTLHAPPQFAPNVRKRAPAFRKRFLRRQPPPDNAQAFRSTSNRHSPFRIL